MSLNVSPTGSRRPTFEALGERLWWARETAHLTQAVLAARLGISKRTIQNYEHGNEAPKLARLVLWANACDVDADWLAGDDYEVPDTGEAASRDTHRIRPLTLAA